MAAGRGDPLRLLVVTDHRFTETDAGVFDTYCFDHDFFRDYLEVFDEVIVAGRMRRIAAPAGKRADGPGVRFVGLPDVRGARWVLAPPAAVERQLREAMQGADAVCVRIPAAAGTRAFELARRIGLPVMFELIGDPKAAMRSDRSLLADLPQLAFGLLGARDVRRVIAGSVAGSYVSVEHLQRRYPAPLGVAIESASSIRLPRAAFRPARSAAPLGGPLRVVLVASLVPVKAHAVLLRAIAALRRMGVDARLTLIGDGGERPRLEALARELGLDEQVRFEGHVGERARIDALLDEHHVFAMTSTSEGMPRAMIEAMARGVPALGSAVGGIAEILPRDQTFRVGDHQALARLLAEVARDPHRRAAMSAASVRIAEGFELGLLRARRVRLFQELARHARQRRAAGVS